jgi:spore coat protein CotH
MKNPLLIITAALILFIGCRKDDIVVLDSNADYSDWSESTHGSSTEPNYSVVFEQNKVLRFDIEISETNWNAMQEDLEEHLGYSGPGGNSFSKFDPVFVPASIKFNGLEWYNVGVRFKGNSSLQSAYQSGNNKLSLKLDFDEFEEYMGEYTDQRFYGFRQLNLNNNFDDPSLMREKVGADLFRQFGLASAQTAFCVVYIDYGQGSQYFGVYALVEEVDDTVLESQFSNGGGNLYKPDGDAASFANGTFDESEMEVKTEGSDYSDVRSLYDIINSSDRTSNPEQWKSDLETVFNVDIFMKWLAANTTIQNWDTYGIMTHNYYLYNNPANGKLTWIPWDNNEAFQEGKQGGALNLSLSEVGNSWPLIRYLKDVDEYNEMYENYLQQFIDEVFIPSEMVATYQSYEALLEEYAYAEEPGYSYIIYGSEFNNEVDELESHVSRRNANVASYLSK